MRLIDAYALMDEYCKANECLQNHGGDCRICFAKSVIMETPTIDPIHAAGGCYCHECVYGEVYRNRDGKEYVDCDYDDYAIRLPNDFCSYGRRKEDQNG